MSRIGNNPVVIPEGVTVEVKDNMLTVKGKLGELSQEFSAVSITVEEGQVLVTRPSESKEHKAKPGNTGLLKRAPLPYVIEGDVVTFKFKTKFKPTLIDHNAKALPEDVTVWGGSIMRINYTPSGYNVASTGIGCSLRLVCCQISKLVEGSNATQGMEPVAPVVADNPLNITEGSY